MNQLRVAVIGLGIGRRHIQAYQHLPGVEVLAVVSSDGAALEKARLDFGIPHAFADYREALTRPDIDAVSICTPDRLHAEQALFALEAGKHVLCEKPITTTLEDAAAVVRKVKDTGLKFMVGHNYRFVPQFVRLKEQVAAGLLGKPFYIESSYVQDLYSMEALGPTYWRFQDPQDLYLGGAVHNVDLLRWVAGEIQEVHSYSNHVMSFYPLDENYVSNFRFAGGQIGRLLLLLGARLKDKFYVDLGVYGPQGALRAVMQRDELIQNLDKLEGPAPVTLLLPHADSHFLEIEHFVDCIRSDQPPQPGAEEGARDIAVCLAAIRSARTGLPEPVDYSFLPSA